MASLYHPRFASQAEPNFKGLFRLLQDFDQYSSSSPGDNKTEEAPAKLFTPKFDVKETQDTYELHGELPGIEKENVTVEFTDPQTIVVRGKVERSYSSGGPSPTSSSASGKGKSFGTPEEATTNKLTAGGDKDAAANTHKPTVDNGAGETGESTTSNNSLAQAKTASTGTEVTQHNGKSTPPVSAHKYWVSERSVGQFSRTFHFPSRVDPDAVSAALNNGILTVTVPKAKKSEGKRISIN